MRLLIDSNRFIDFCNKEESVIRILEQAQRVFVPFIVLAEIRVGAFSVKRGDEQVRVLTELLQQPGVAALHSSDNTTRHYGTLYNYLKKKGRPIPTNDIWIAALAMEHDLVLYTRDAHFREFESIPKL